MKDKISIMHISDSHRGKDTLITNSALLTSLLNDKEKYTTAEVPLIQAPDIIIVCGDIIRGSENEDNSDQEIQHQYDEAIGFLTDLASEFLGGDKHRIVLVPGNHDVDWKYSRESMAKIDNTQVLDSNNQLKSEYLRQAINQRSEIKWSWKELSFYKIVNHDVYLKRFEAFSNFYEAFYDGRKSYSLIPDSQYDIFDFPEFKISIVGYNSCYNNDHLNLVGDIHPDCIASSTPRLKELAKKGGLQMAAWHHNTKGLPYDANYMDSSRLKNFIESGIALGFHGHQHKTEIVRDYNNMIEQKKIVVFSAGTLCGGPGELPVGHNQQYNIVEIEPNPEDDSTMKVTLHTREKTSTSSFDNPIWGQGRIDSSNISYIHTSIPKPVPATPTAALLEAEALLRENRCQDAKETLLQLDLSDPFVRKFLLESLSRTDDIDTICKIFNPPQNNEEAVHLLSATFNSGHKKMMAECIEHSFIKDSSDPAIREMRTKIKDYLS